MAETAESLHRRGAISEKQMKKMMGKSGMPKILKKTKVERADEEEFHGKQGMRDQGMNRDRGIKDTGRDAINKNQRDTSAIAGKPSRGGFVQNGKGMTPGTDEIGQRANQRPDFPKAGGTTMASRGGRDDTGGYSGDRMPNKSGSMKIDRRVKPASNATNPRSKGKMAKQGSWYGGGGQDTQ